MYSNRTAELRARFREDNPDEGISEYEYEQREVAKELSKKISKNQRGKGPKGPKRNRLTGKWDVKVPGMDTGSEDELTTNVFELKVGRTKGKKRARGGAKGKNKDRFPLDVMVCDKKTQTETSTGASDLPSKVGVGTTFDETETLACTVCYESFSPSLPPQSSSCGHLVCSICVTRLFDSVPVPPKGPYGVPLKRARCPTCRSGLFRQDFIRLNVQAYKVSLKYRYAVRRLMDGLEKVKNDSMVDMTACLESWVQSEMSKLSIVSPVVDRGALASGVPKMLANIQAEEVLAKLKHLQKRVNESIASFQTILQDLSELDLPISSKLEPGLSAAEVTTRHLYNSSGTRGARGQSTENPRVVYEDSSENE